MHLGVLKSERVLLCRKTLGQELSFFFNTVYALTQRPPKNVWGTALFFSTGILGVSSWVIVPHEGEIPHHH